MAAPTDVEVSVALANTWKISYQNRQSGVAGPSVLDAMALPPTAMVTAAAVVEP
jgi:hypothetical protein